MGGYEENKEDPEKYKLYLEEDKQTLDKELKGIVGTEKAAEVANLKVGEKLGLLDIVEFTPPTEVAQVAQKVAELLDKGTAPAQLTQQYVAEKKSKAVNTVFLDQAKKEAEAVGGASKYWAGDVTKLTPAEMEVKYNEWLSHMSEVTKAEIVSGSDFYNLEKRAEAITTFDKASESLEKAGVENVYLSPDLWKEAYDKYAAEGKLPDDFVQKCDAASVAFKAWEEQNPGVSNDPTGATYDSKAGTFNYIDHKGEFVAGTYDSKKDSFVYTNENGEFRFEATLVSSFPQLLRF